VAVQDGDAQRNHRYDCLTTLPATYVIPPWSPESGCGNPIVELAAGGSKGL
jgi:hypothetical protein